VTVNHQFVSSSYGACLLTSENELAPRVLYCTDTYPPQVNGVSVVTARTAAGLRVRGWQVGVIAPRYPSRPRQGVRQFVDEFESADLHVEVPSTAFPPYPDIRLAAPAYWRIARTIREFQPDLVHCATEFMIGRLGQIAAQRAGVALVTSYHTDFSRYAKAYGAPRLRTVVSNYIARFHGRALRTYTPSRMARADLVALGVRDVEVWGRTIDARTFAPERRDLMFRRLNGWDRKFVVLHVGRLAAEKSVHTILEGFRIARGLLPAGSVHLVVAGGGPDEPALRRAASPDVTFLGVLDHKYALPQLYASADAFAFASLTETLGLVVLEAMASGLPVIATPAGGVADHLRNGENGLAFPAGNATEMAHAVVRLVMDPALRDRLALGARRTAESLDWEGELDRLDASYREVNFTHAGWVRGGRHPQNRSRELKALQPLG
jgi:glycosyltransferase involved in cell wall biosynthesis